MVPPLISIVLTVYERVNFLDTAIQHALSQTYENFELIITDDSASEEIRKLCRKYESDPRIRYRSNPSCIGAALNIRAALEEAKGDYFTILNDDDFWDPDFLEPLVSALEADPSRVIAFCDHWIVGDDGSRNDKATETNSRHFGRSNMSSGDVADPAELILKKNSVPLAMASLIRTSAVKLEDITKECGWAYDFWLANLLAASGGKFHYIGKRLSNYRVHSTMETGRKAPDKYLPMVYIFEQLLARGLFPNYEQVLKRRLGGAYFRCGRFQLTFGNAQTARTYFLKAVAQDPGFKYVITWLLSFLPSFVRRFIFFLR